MPWLLAALVIALSSGVGYAWHVAYSRGAASMKLKCEEGINQLKLEKAAALRKAQDELTTSLDAFYKLQLDKAHETQRQLSASLLRLQAKQKESDDCAKELNGRVPDCLVDYIDRVPARKAP